MLLPYAAAQTDTRTNRPRCAALPSALKPWSIFEEHLIDEIQESLPALWNEVDRGATAFIVLVPRRAPPQTDSDYAEPVSSFFCSSDLFARFLALGIDCWATTLCFAVLRAIASGEIEVDRLLVRQIPTASRRLYGGETPSNALLMPHRGDPAHLRVALKYIDKSAGNPLAVRVGLDENDECVTPAFARISAGRILPVPPRAGRAICYSPGTCGKIGRTTADFAGRGRPFVL